MDISFLNIQNYRRRLFLPLLVLKSIIIVQSSKKACTLKKDPQHFTFRSSLNFHPHRFHTTVDLFTSQMDNDTYKRLQTQTGVSTFWAEKHARECSRNWDKFYKRNTTNFYKDRHWTTEEQTDGFPCLKPTDTSRKHLVEAGCGVANCAFPLLSVNPSLFIYAFDFAPTAVNLVKSSPQYDPNRIHAFVWDFSQSAIENVAADERKELKPDHADFCTLVFVLSAVPPDNQLSAIKHLAQLLKPGGRLLFRDYATGDMAEKRFASRSKIHDNYFVRQDETLSYFFDEHRLRSLASEAGLEEDYIRRVSRVITNRKEKKDMHRVFLQAEFVKSQ